MAAVAALAGVANAAANPSPPVAKTYPPWRSMALRTMASWICTAAAMSAGDSSQSRVESSMSVKRNVTVPDGAATATRAR